MKKWIFRLAELVIVVMVIGAFTIGAEGKGCGSEGDKLAVTQLALASVQVGAQWMNTTVQVKCKPEPHDGWTQEDCDTWNENWPIVIDVVENILPWAIDKLWETTTPEEREEVFKAFEKDLDRRLSGK